MCFDNTHCDHEVVGIEEEVEVLTCGDCNAVFWADTVDEVDEHRSAMVDDSIVKVWSARPTEVGCESFECFVCGDTVSDGGFVVVADIYDVATV